MRTEKKMRIAFLAVILTVIIAAVIAVSITKKKSGKQEPESFDETTEPAVTEESADEKLPEEEPEEIPYQAPAELIELMEANPSVVGWLKIEDTNIDYPVVQNREDNEWFLHRDIYGNKNQSGSIYLDSNHDMNQKGIHTVYGHRMKNGTMFKDISRFTDEEYFNNHKNITLWTDKQELPLKPVYCYTGEADGSYRDVLSSRKALETFLLKKTGQHISSDNVFVFITCSYEQKDGRCYLICSGAD